MEVENLKNFVIGTVVLSICACLLCGCSGKPQDSNASASGSQFENQTMTEEELYQYFQQVFDAKGNALDTPEQIALELVELTALTADVASLPNDIETQYRTWRTGYIKEMLVNLQKEYDGIIGERPRFDGINPGLSYADCVDLDNNGIQELLLLSFSMASEENGYTYYDNIAAVTVEVYGESHGHAAKHGEFNLSWDHTQFGSLGLYSQHT